MSDTNRTKYTATIELTARELEAVKRFCAAETAVYWAGHTVIGDFDLAMGVLRNVRANAKANDTASPSTDLHRE